MMVNMRNIYGKGSRVVNLLEGILCTLHVPACGVGFEDPFCKIYTHKRFNPIFIWSSWWSWYHIRPTCCCCCPLACLNMKSQIWETMFRDQWWGKYWGSVYVWWFASNVYVGVSGVMICRYVLVSAHFW